MAIKNNLLMRMRKYVDRRLVDVPLAQYQPLSESYSADPEEHVHFPLGRFMRRSLWQKDGKGGFSLVGQLACGCFGLSNEYGVMRIGPHEQIMIERQGSVANWILNDEVIGRVYYSPWLKWFKFSTIIPISPGTSSVATGFLKTPLFFSATRKASAYGTIAFDKLEDRHIPFKVRTIADEFRTRNDGDIENLWHSEINRQVRRPHEQACPIIEQSHFGQLSARQLLFLHGVAVWSRVFYVPFGGTNRGPSPNTGAVEKKSNKGVLGTR